jgi:signal transduction histidine kinase
MKERDKLAAMGEMAAGLAHEIRNPLGAIKASAQYLRETPPRGAGTTSSCTSSSRRSIAEPGGLVVPRLRQSCAGDAQMLCDVNAVVERTAQVLADGGGTVDLHGRAGAGAGLPKVRIDAERLRQVLINLIQNALQAIEAGGTLRIETRRARDARQRGEPDRWVEISVATRARACRSRCCTTCSSRS